jgi:hypothetical protein
MKFANDGDTRCLLIHPPYSGFEKMVTNKATNVGKLKPHYYCTILGSSLESDAIVPMTYKEIKDFGSEAQKSWTVNTSIQKDILDCIESGDTILYVRRKGIANSADTKYLIMSVLQMKDADFKALLPRLTKADVDRLQEETDWSEDDRVMKEMVEDAANEAEDASVRIEHDNME